MPRADRTDRTVFHHLASGQRTPAGAVNYPVLFLTPTGSSPVRDTLVGLPKRERSTIGLGINAAGADFDAGRDPDMDPMRVAAAMPMFELRLTKQTGFNWRAILVLDQLGGRTTLVILHAFNKKTDGRISGRHVDVAAERAATWASYGDAWAVIRRAAQIAAIAAARRDLHARDGHPR